MTFKQLRPVDMLANVLKNVEVNSNSIVEEFEEFIGKFTIQEVCNMLVQIISDGSDTEYISSVKIDQASGASLNWNGNKAQGKSQY